MHLISSHGGTHEAKTLQGWLQCHQVVEQREFSCDLCPQCSSLPISVWACAEKRTFSTWSNQPCCWCSWALTIRQPWLTTQPPSVSLLLRALKFSLASRELQHNLALTKINCPGTRSCFSRYSFKIIRSHFSLSLLWQGSIVKASKIVTYNTTVTPEYPSVYFLMRGNSEADGDL